MSKINEHLFSESAWRLLAAAYRAYVKHPAARRRSAPLRVQVPEPLLNADGSMRGAGLAYYERHYGQYRKRYPAVRALAPLDIAPPAYEMSALQSQAVRTFGQALWDAAVEAGREVNIALEHWSYPGEIAMRERFGISPGLICWACEGRPLDTLCQFQAMCAFAGLSESQFPDVLALYPPPGSDRERFARAVEVCLAKERPAISVCPPEIRGIGPWSRRQFVLGRPLHEALFVKLCEWSGLNPAGYPGMELMGND